LQVADKGYVVTPLCEFLGQNERSGYVYCSVCVLWSMRLVPSCHCASLLLARNINGARQKWYI